MLNTQLRYILVAMVSTIWLQCVSKTPQTQNINSAKALNKKYQLNITSNLVLPLNKAGLDSLKKEYLLIVDRNAQVIDEESEEGKNLNEEPMIRTLIDRYRKKYSFSYNKVYEQRYGEKLLANINSLKDFDLNVIVLNFVDMLSHARTESKMIRELANTEAAYRSLTTSWFKHSMTYNLFKRISEMGYKVILTTDHGTIRVKNPVKIVGDKNTNTNLRYKVGKSLSVNPKEVFEIAKPESIGLPKCNLSDRYVFSLGNDFFAYPNNYNYYVQYYKDTFQHGGVSLEEMLVPIIIMNPK